MLNSGKAKPKHPRVEKSLSNMVLIIFIIQVICCAFASLYYLISLEKRENSLQYLGYALKSHSFVSDFILRILNWILIFTNFVPISMLVTLELVRFIQSYQIAGDSKMQTGPISPVVQSSNLNEEMGQIEYVFSDKTGTLTSNQMVFKMLSINGSIYGGDISEEEGEERNGRELSNRGKNVTNVNFADEEFFRIFENPSHEEHEDLCNMVLAQAICHTVILEEVGNETSYSASSPDELALVNFAKLCGYEYMGIDEQNVMTIKTPEKERHFQLLNVFEFNSDRKRMSVIVRDDKNKVVLFCKGADSIVFERLSRSTSQKIKEATDGALQNFGNDGLRTLVYSMKTLDLKEYHQWMTKYKIAMTSMVDREKVMESLQDELERDLELLGATGIEDLLQDQVDETIDFILDAEIKLWVLTGDKVETARSIGKSCGLIRPNMKEFLIRANNDQELDQQLSAAFETMIASSEGFKFYIIVTGETLLFISNSSRHKELLRKFTELALEANTVLACRVSPKQKQEVVEMVRRAKPLIISLAIGDGANDVNMITAAQVGVGIRGKEGLQAARASDYSIGEFKHLKPLLFVHGREFYRKNSHVILYNFFKNMTLVLPQFWYGFLDMFSGQTLYDPFAYQLFNTFYASLPIIIYAVCDYQYTENIFENYPKLYDLGKKNKIFTYFTFLKWIFSGAIQAVFLSLFSFYITQDKAINEDGILGGFWLAGGMTFTIAVLNANFKMFLFSYSRSVLSVIIIFASILVYYLSLIIISNKRSSSLFGTLEISETSVYYWAGIIVTLVITNGVDMAIGRVQFFEDTEYIQIQKMQKMSVRDTINTRDSFHHRKPEKKKESFLQVSL